jgi:hypothetical protein
MPQSLAQIYLHIVFSTKNRTPFLKERQLRDNLHANVQPLQGWFFGAFRVPRVRSATLGFVVEPRRGSSRAVTLNGSLFSLTFLAFSLKCSRV